MNTTATHAVTPARSSGADIVDWRPEDNEFWESTGKRIAYRNLAISVPALLCGFAVWGMWGIITVQMLNLGFPFTQAELFTLTAIAGISGATMRIPASFLIRLAGGRNTIFLTTAMLLAPAIGTGVVLLVWIYLSGFIILLGGEMNAILRKHAHESDLARRKAEAEQLAMAAAGEAEQESSPMK